MSLNDFLKAKNLIIGEGFSQQIPRQTKILKKYACRKKVKNILEIGFNAGHSAEIFLSSNVDVSLFSFDIAKHE